MLPEAVVLSEVHPKGSGLPKLSITDQLSRWYNTEVNSNNSYEQIITEVYEICKTRNKDLIIRDFSEYDFISGVPNSRLSNLQTLSRIGEVNPIAIVRDPIDMYLSRNFDSNFFERYYAFIETIASLNIPTVKYEEFCKEPKSTMKLIAKTLETDYSDKFYDFHKVAQVSGDINYMGYDKTPGRSAEKLIQLNPRKKAPYQIRKKFNKDLWLQRCQQKLDYPRSYKSRPIAKKPSQLYCELSYWLKKISS